MKTGFPRFLIVDYLKPKLNKTFMFPELFFSHCRGYVLFILLLTPVIVLAKSKKGYWQQEITYKMDVQFDVATHKFTSEQRMRYRNNSPETLKKVFFHLYLNAFQPGSAMDVRSRTIPDPDPRVGDRILSLKPDEIGFQHILDLKQNGTDLKYTVEGTILEVELARPIPPGGSATFDMLYEAQVPVQIRRNGRDNKEGISYSMSQWYPKMCEFDENGWHANPYIGREFYGVWGDFEFNLTIDSRYVVAATGTLRNSKEVGHGYAPEPTRRPAKLTWCFKAENVHDFVWAADPDYTHEIYRAKNGIAIHTFYQSHPDYNAHWEALPRIIEEAFNYINAHFGEYPYESYSFIQGGDGGMEYPMATLITGHRSLTSLVGVSVHELLHSWYQMVLGLDESHYYWMDEGFTDYAETRVMNHLRSLGLIPGEKAEFPFDSQFESYRTLVLQGIEEPLSTHADHFDFNTAYGIGAYVKGSIFLHQLEYIIGKDAFARGMLDFYNEWKFKHPDANDFIRIMEIASDLELDWYREYMVNTTKTIDYAVDSTFQHQGVTSIIIGRYGGMPMPVDLEINLQNGSSLKYTIPLDIMRGSKSGDGFIVLPDWQWVNPSYTLEIPHEMSAIKSIKIDPQKQMADLDRDNNAWPLSKS